MQFRIILGIIFFFNLCHQCSSLIEVQVSVDYRLKRAKNITVSNVTMLHRHLLLDNRVEIVNTKTGYKYE